MSLSLMLLKHPWGQPLKCGKPTEIENSHHHQSHGTIVIKFCSHLVLESLDTFQAALKDGTIFKSTRPTRSFRKSFRGVP